MAKIPKDHPLLPERLAAKLWRQRKGGLLRTLDGAALRVLYPGRPNGGPGPDFRDALVQPLGAPVQRGDVEVHRQASGWKEHGHGRDPGYNNVVLHLVYGDASPQGETYRQDGQRVPVALVSLDTPPGDEGVPYPAADGTAQRLAAWRAMSPAAREATLAQAGEERFLQRSAAFRLALAGGDPDQTLYRGLMEALGYSRNRLPFLELAHRLPWEALWGAVRAAPPGQEAAVLEALLLFAGGLSVAPSPPPGLAVTPMVPSAWRLAGLRPQNHPRRRIAGAAHLFARAAEEGLAAFYAGRARRERSPLLFSALEARENGQALIGRDRALDMAVNILLPFLHAWATLTGDASLAGASLSHYRGAPKLADNDVLREMAYLLGLPPSQMGRDARHQQGAIHLYRTLLKEGDAHLYDVPSIAPDALQERRSPYVTAQEAA
ncbi:MAG: DUF2851 family protein [Chloroflexi bacterium]|nr:DUF2851 family protein [Chloroflexota bacterium]